jgi:hypothetical protein
MVICRPGGDMTERVEFDSMPPEPERLIWCDWLRWHGIDPNQVAVPGWIERHADARRIQYESFRTDEHGGRIFRGDTVLRTVQVQQLEAVPSPLPRFDGREQHE